MRGRPGSSFCVTVTGGGSVSPCVAGADWDAADAEEEEGGSGDCFFSSATPSAPLLIAGASTLRTRICVHVRVALTASPPSRISISTRPQLSVTLPTTSNVKCIPTAPVVAAVTAELVAATISAGQAG